MRYKKQILRFETTPLPCHISFFTFPLEICRMVYRYVMPSFINYSQTLWVNYRVYWVG